LLNGNSAPRRFVGIDHLDHGLRAAGGLDCGRKLNIDAIVLRPDDRASSTA